MILLKYKSNHISPVVSHHAYNKILILCHDLIPSNLSTHVLHSFFAQFILQLWLSCCSSNTLSSLCPWAFTPDVPSLRILFPQNLHDRPLWIIQITVQMTPPQGDLPWPPYSKIALSAHPCTPFSWGSFVSLHNTPKITYLIYSLLFPLESNFHEGIEIFLPNR